MIRQDWSDSDFNGLPAVSDEDFNKAFSSAPINTLGHGERLKQMVSFVWGNALESDQSTYESVCENLGIDASILEKLTP